MLGERLAITVLDKIYGIGRGADAPELLEAVTASDMEISLSFDNVTGFLYDFNSSLEDFPIKIEDEAGKVGITDFSIYANIIKIRLERELCGEAYVSGQSGSDPKNIIIDYGTQIPILCFSKIKILKGENR